MLFFLFELGGDGLFFGFILIDHLHGGKGYIEVKNNLILFVWLITTGLLSHENQ